MTGTEKIIAHIEADAKSQAEAILAAAAARCAEINSKYELQAAELYQAKIREGVKACQDKEDGALRITRMEARKSTLAVKQEMVTKSFDMALNQIISLPKDQYIAFLKRLALQASSTGDEEVLLNARDRESVGEELLSAINSEPGKALTLSDETRDIAGGLLLRRGNVEANCSAELLVDLSRSELSSKLANVLFS